METFTPAPSEDATNFGAIDVSEHGSSGPINVSFSNYWAPTEVNSAWAPALSSLGIPINDQAVRVLREVFIFFRMVTLLASAT